MAPFGTLLCQCSPEADLSPIQNCVLEVGVGNSHLGPALATSFSNILHCELKGYSLLFVLVCWKPACSWTCGFALPGVP